MYVPHYEWYSYKFIRATEFIPATSKNQGRNVKVLNEFHTFGMTVCRQIEASQTITSDGISTALQDDGAWLEDLHNTTNDLLLWTQEGVNTGSKTKR